MEPEISQEVEAAERLATPRPDDVPPQLRLALEKDGRGLARGFQAARVLSKSVLQTLRDTRDSRRVRWTKVWWTEIRWTEVRWTEVRLLRGRVSPLRCLDLFVCLFVQSAVTAEHKLLRQRMDELLLWLKETEAQMDRGTETTEDTRDQIGHQLKLFKVS